MYQVKEIFYTLQGEGMNAGRPAVFCRFAGCNLWSGREKDRAGAVCRFCDTDFVGTDGTNGSKYASASALAEELGGKPLIELILEHTHTCYLGNRERHEWGPGCGECPACKLRKDGHARYRAARASRRSA